ncbi:MAG: hypothetical protein MMC33_002377 [Icmadophila ericetorum]|nr:hypothetical protein [Icmadophila ericetorum]
MAAQSTPQLRTSQRHRNPTVTVLRDSDPPSSGHNDHHHHHPPPPATHRRKRAHDTISSNDCHPAVKKQKLDAKTLLHPNAALRDHFASKSFNAASSDHSSANSTVNSRIISAVQPSANGTSITNGDLPHRPATQTAPSQTSNTSKEVDKRTLRSQGGGSRSRSELALYFPNYDELIGNEPKETESITPETVLYISDDHTHPQLPQPPPPFSLPCLPIISTSDPPPDSPTNQFHVIIFPNPPDDVATDPLSDSFYFKAHRRAERSEKQLRNIEKERAQHEKVQLERLLEGLRGPDWLKVMGISGITDSEKKSFEGKREYFIREVSFLIEKFRKWREEERKRKLEKDLASEAADDDDEDDEEEGEEEQEEKAVEEGKIPSPTNPAARQLHLEAMSHHPKLKPRPSRPRRPDPHISPAFSAPEAPPITSFFHKCPHLRTSSLAGHLPPITPDSHSPSNPKVKKEEGTRGSATTKATSGSAVAGRRSARSASRYVYAFGCQMPDFEERDFEMILPGSWLVGEIRAQGRRWGRFTRRKGREDAKEKREKEEEIGKGKGGGGGGGEEDR